MFATIVFTVAAFACLMALMAVGLVLQGKRLRGSCGGDTDSPDCRCSPEKQAKCREKSEEDLTSDAQVYAMTSLTEENLAAPGEERLIQLRHHAEQ